MISEPELNDARQRKNDAEAIIAQYHREQSAAFEERVKTNPVFTDSELIYSRDSLCPCGHGLAYPAACGPGHYWDCSAILKGIADPQVKHCGQMPFAFYEIKSERGEETTRGMLRPQPKAKS